MQYGLLRCLESNQTLNDPLTVATIIEAAIQGLQAIFPNIFGGNRRRLTDEDWNKLIPYNGYWHNQLRAYLKSAIHYDVDAVNNVVPFTKYFAIDHNMTIDQLNALLKQEAAGQSVPDSPYLNYDNPLAGGVGSMDTTTLLLIGGAVIFLMSQSNKKRTRKRR